MQAQNVRSCNMTLSNFTKQKVESVVVVLVVIVIVATLHWHVRTK